MFETLVNLIPTLGFPIVCVIAMAVFVVRLTDKNTASNEAMVTKIQEQNEKREDKLYNEIAECRAINAKAIETISVYAEKLTSIQQDVKEIKTDVIELKAKN